MKSEVNLFKSMDLSADLKRFCIKNGADLVGIADLTPLKTHLVVIPEDLLTPYSFGISIAIHLSDAIMDAINDQPTPEYAELYLQTNAKLDEIAEKLLAWITKKRHTAIHIPASHMINAEELRGNVSHRAIAHLAGLGWIGKSLSLITPQFGPRVRLVSVLTDLPLIADIPLENQCGLCEICTDACPAHAIKNVNTTDYYETREEAVDLQKCYEQVTYFKSLPDIGKTICGICTKECPYGKSSIKKTPAI